MADFNRTQFLSQFWTAQLIAGAVMAMKGARAGWYEGGAGNALMFAFSSFFLVMPAVALAVVVLMYLGVGEHAPPQARRRGAIITGLGISLLIVVIGAMDRG